MVSHVKPAVRLALLLSLVMPWPVRGQVQPGTAHRIRWYEATSAAAGVGVMMLLDEPVQRLAQRHRNAATDDLAAVFRPAGEPEVFGTVSLGLAAAGLVAHRPAVTRAGGRLVASLCLAGATTVALKALLGRARPDAGAGAFDFDPFTRSQALPSGHTAMAFALAASLADEVRSPVVRIGLYGMATGTGLSRINDNRHWASDVGLGGLIGVASAKLVRGRWRVFGIAPPRLLIAPDGAAALGWRRSF